MPSADTNRMRLSYREETTYGVQATGGNFQTLRLTGESLKQDTDSRISDEIRNDRQIADVFRTSVSASGQLTCELSGATLDDFLAAAIGASTTWPAVVTGTPGTVTTVAATGTYTAVAGDFDNILVNQWVFISGFVNAGNNGFKKVLSVTGTPATVFTVDSPLTMGADETTVSSIIVTMGSQVINGTAFTSFSIQKEFLDLEVNEGSFHLGMAIESVDLRISTGEPLTGSFSFLGSEEKNPVISTDGTGTAQASAGGTLVLTAGNPQADDFYNNDIATITAGTGKGQARLITDYDTGTVTCTVTPNWTVTPDATSTYEIVAPFIATDVANTNAVMQSVDHILHTLEGGHDAANIIPITELEISIRNNNRNRMQVGNVAAVSQGLGSFEVTGSIRQFYETNELFKKYIDYTASSIAVVISETGTPYRYVIELPQVRYGDAQRVAGGKDQDILADVSFTAYMNPTASEGQITMRIARFLV